MPALRTLMAAMLLPIVSGCGPLTVQVRSLVPLNANEFGESTAVAVRFYQLRRPDRFRSASAARLWNADAETLGGERIGDPVVVTILPGTVSTGEVTVDLGHRHGDTTCIGVFALFAGDDDRSSRILVLDADELSQTTVLLSGSSVSAVPRRQPDDAPLAPMGQAAARTSGP
jgi:type VI secretion system VasD/TssJ family lipoprotein